MKIKVQESSMQYSDTPKQHEKDAKAVFSLGSHIVLGTEAGPGSNVLPAALKQEAEAKGYWFYVPRRPTDCWVAVKKSLMPDKPRTGYIPVIEGSSESGDPHRYGPKGIVWMRGKTSLGRLSVASFHGLTKARYPGMAQHDKPGDPVDHRAENERLGHALGDWATQEGKGTNLVFAGGDTNLLDRTDDVFFGAPLTTCWDELKTWPATGHGNIDVIASYDRDGRVKCLKSRVLHDRDLHLFSDHFTVVATYEVAPLPKKGKKA